MAAERLQSDVVVVGGGPAGLAAAIALRQCGCRVIVADQSKPPIDKACGEGLMPEAVAALKLLGVSLGPAQAVPFRGIRFLAEGRAAQGVFPEGHGLGVRRTTLHSALAARAADVGVQFLWGSPVRSISRAEVQLDAFRIRARWIVGADGQNSQLRKWAGLDPGPARQTRFGFRQHFRSAPWTDLVEVYWGRDCQIVITPVSPDEVCAAVTSRAPQLRMKQALLAFPELAARLQSGAVSKELGGISALRVVRKVGRGRLALVGDASGSVDSLTGEGVGLAFGHALALAEAAGQDDLERYSVAHRRINRRHEIMSRVLLAFEHRPWLRRRAMEILSREPQILERLIAAHVGSFTPFSPGFLSNVLKLSWRMVASAS